MRQRGHMQNMLASRLDASDMGMDGWWDEPSAHVEGRNEVEVEALSDKSCLRLDSRDAMDVMTGPQDVRDVEGGAPRLAGGEVGWARMDL
jgi:hypothetical protein